MRRQFCGKFLSRKKTSIRGLMVRFKNALIIPKFSNNQNKNNTSTNNNQYLSICLCNP